MKAPGPPPDANEPAWTTQYTVYDGNWLNWRSNPPTVAEVPPRDRQGGGQRADGRAAGRERGRDALQRRRRRLGRSQPWRDIETSRASVTAIVNAAERRRQHAAVRDPVRGRPVLPGRAMWTTAMAAPSGAWRHPGWATPSVRPSTARPSRRPAARTSSSCSPTASPPTTPARSARSPPCRTSPRSLAPPAMAAAKAVCLDDVAA